MEHTAHRPSPAVEDYAKAIYSLAQRAQGGHVTTNALAERLGVTPGSASGMVRRLDDKVRIYSRRGADSRPAFLASSKPCAGSR